MFNRSNSNTEGFSREDAVAEVRRLDGRIDSVQAALRALRAEGEQAVRALRAEGLAALSQARGTATPERAAARTQEAPRPVAGTTGVDYGAVAFGLKEISRKVGELVGSTGRVNESELKREYEGTVQYFADVFAKADPNFDEVSFKRAAGLNPPQPYERSHP